MSLILDALRKSEAERRRGQAPDLYAELPPVTRRTPVLVQPWWWLAVVLALGTLLAWAVSQRAPAPSPSAPATMDSIAETQRDRLENGRANAPGNPAAPIPTAPIPAVAADVVAAPPLYGTSQVVAVPADTVKATPPQDPNPIPGPAVRATNRESTPAPLAATPPLATPPPLGPRVQPALPPGSTLPASPAPATPLADPGSPIGLSDLSAGERQQLPPLKVSMHLWDSNPASRFAIIDGSRVGEGDRLGDAYVESITRDGLVLVWNGRRLRLGIR